MTPRTRSLAILVFGFTLLGMPSSALGVAWPTMADELDRSLGDLGAITIATGSAYAVMSISSGWLSKRFAAGWILVGTAFLTAMALVGFAAAESWVLLVAAAVPLGVGGGALDSLGNSFVAVRRGPRAMGAIHAAFGFGSMLAPLFMTALLTLGVSWRVGFMALAGAQLALALALLTIVGIVRMPMEGSRERPTRFGRRRLLALSVWAFFIYAGVEGSTGFWAFTLLTEGQGISEAVAGVAVAVHWGALTASRVLIGFVGDRVSLDATITASVVGITVGLVLMWWNPAAWVTVLGLVASGFASGPVFPLEVLLTSRRFGAEFTPWAVGYQVAAATASIAVVPAVIGLLVNAFGPLAIGPALVALSVVMAVSVEVLRSMSASDPARVPSADGV